MARSSTALIPSSESEAYAEIDRWITEPLYWAKRFLGHDFDPWSGQEELWNQYGRLLNAKLKRLQAPNSLTPEETALADKWGITVMAGHGMGKERSVAGIGLHYLSVLQVYQPKGLCTAPAGPTLHSTLWPEFGKVIAGSDTLSALFEKQSNRIYLRADRKRGEFMRIEPRTIQTNSDPEEQGTVLAGIHATGVIYLITEASGVPEAVFKPIEGGLTDPLSLIIMIFNPTKRDGFAALSHTKNRRNWICMQWDGIELKKEKLRINADPNTPSPRFQWYNERAQDTLIEKYGLDSDTVRIRVRGLPPQQAADTLIHYESAMAASERLMEVLEHDPIVVFADVGGEGDDPSVVTTMIGPRLVRQRQLRQKDTTQVAAAVASALAEAIASAPAGTQSAVGIDTIGLGRGVYDQLLNVHQVRSLYKLDVSQEALDKKRFHRLRDQVWWELREGFMEEKEVVLSPAACETPAEFDELIAELTSIRWGEPGGKIKVQGKGASSGIPGVKPLSKSPNLGDSLVGAWYIYKHCTSRLPASHRRQRLVRRRPASWKAA